VHRVPATTEVLVLTGSRDDNTTPDIGRRYAAALVARGVRATFEAVEGAGHGFGSLQEAAQASVDRMLLR
jgi:acetyl esterase/lipase